MSRGATAARTPTACAATSSGSSTAARSSSSTASSSSAAASSTTSATPASTPGREGGRGKRKTGDQHSRAQRGNETTALLVIGLKKSTHC
jgi:hypothetical protein